ncbi:MAG: aldo/keto reductase [Candidatus Devosia euplotis]|nr:aldo/keto reductase [Candidatus Devosia euplotis]
MARTFEKRRIGQTGLEVTTLGLGRSEHLVGDIMRTRRADSLLSTKVGRLLRPVSPDQQDKSAWVDPLPFEQRYGYFYDGIMRSFEDSLQRLGVSNVDILYVHDIGTAAHGAEANKPLLQQLAGGGYRALRELRQSCVIGAIGLSVNE